MHFVCTHSAKVARACRKPSTNAWYTGCRSCGCNPSSARSGRHNLDMLLLRPSGDPLSAASRAMPRQTPGRTYPRGPVRLTPKPSMLLALPVTYKPWEHSQCTPTLHCKARKKTKNKCKHGACEQRRQYSTLQLGQLTQRPSWPSSVGGAYSPMCRPTDHARGSHRLPGSCTKG